MGKEANQKSKTRQGRNSGNGKKNNKWNGSDKRNKMLINQRQMKNKIKQRT